MGHALSPVLVTGASGYLGGRVLALLRSRGVLATGVARSGTDLACDLLNSRAVHALLARHAGSIVIHCAALVPRDLEGYAAEDAAQDSFRMLSNVLAAKPFALVLASSMTVYPSGTRLANEVDARSDGAGYAAGKLRAEELLLERSCPNDTVLRFPGLFGEPRRGGVLYNAALAFAKGGRPVLCAPLPQWAALHVEDAADICIRALTRPDGTQKVLNAGYSGAMSIPDAVRRIAALSGRDAGDLPEAPVFEFDLRALHRALGPVATGWEARLEEIVAQAQATARNGALHA